MNPDAISLPKKLLIEVHNILKPWPKDGKVPWDARDEDNNAGKKLFSLLKPVWKELSQRPLRLQAPSPTDEDYLEQCYGLIHIIDQTRAYFKGIDERWTRAFFDPACEKLALELYRSQESPYRKETWLKRGWTFENYVARIIGLMAPLIHSENVMANDWNLNKGLIHYLRKEVEDYSGQKDPYAVTEEEDSKNMTLFSELIAERNIPTSGVADYTFWWLRTMTSHVPITNKFGRYPYTNDLVGRDFKKGELEWMELNSEMFRRAPTEVREAIRRDVDAGVWSPLKLDYDVT